MAHSVEESRSVQPTPDQAPHERPRTPARRIRFVATALTVVGISNSQRPRASRGAWVVRPAWAHDLAVRVRYGGWLPQPLAEGQGVRREAGSEGSRRQSPDLRDTNRI